MMREPEEARIAVRVEANPTGALAPAVTLALSWTLLALAACGGAAATAPRGPEAPPPNGPPVGRRGAADVVGFGSAGTSSRRDGERPRAQPMGVSGRVGGREVRLASAYVLTPDVEGPVELHAFEATVAERTICPGGLAKEPPGVVLRVVLPDTRHNDDPALVTWAGDAGPVTARAAKVALARTRSRAPTLASIDVRGDGDDRLAGTLLVVVCPDDREAPPER